MAVDDASVLRTVQDVPGLGLSEIRLRFAGIFVVRVHLDGQILRRFDQFDQEGKPGLRAGAEIGLRIFPHEIIQGFPPEGSFLNDAGPVGMAGDEPVFADGLFRFGAEPGFQPVAAPDPRYGQGGEFDRFEIVHGDPLSTTGSGAGFFDATLRRRKRRR